MIEALTLRLDHADPKRLIYREIKPWLRANGLRFIDQYTYTLAGRKLLITFMDIDEEFKTWFLINWGGDEV